MSYHMKAKFEPAQNLRDGYRGSVSLTVADAILIRGIALFAQNDATGYSLSFPAFGERKQSYIFPVSRDAYRSMLRLSTDAMRNRKTHTAELPGSSDIELSVTGELVDEPNADGRFSLCIADLCKLNGITTYETPYLQPDHSNVLVSFPSLTPHQVPKEQILRHSLFHGLGVTKDAPDGSLEYKDYQVIITDMVREKRAELITFREIQQIESHSFDMPRSSDPISRSIYQR